MLYNVQYLRFIAAGMVLLHHTLESIARYWPGSGDRQFVAGAAGVDIFFAISGFIMVFITEKKERSPLDFIRHRWVRVAPPYWFVTIFLACAIIAAPSEFKTSRFEFPHFLASMLFLPYAHPTLQEAAPLYLPGWTLNYEFFFYSLFAVALAINAGNRVVLTSSALILFVIAGFAWPHGNLWFDFYTDPILLEFVFGMIIGQLTIGRMAVPRFASISLIVLGIVGLIIAAEYRPIWRLSTERFLVWGLPAALLVAGSILLEFSKSARPVRSLVVLGNASYAIYITHFVALGPVLKTCKWIGLSPGPLLVVLGFAAATAIGVLFHFLIERPLIGFISEHAPGTRRMAPVTPAGAPEPENAVMAGPQNGNNELLLK
jgi:exopolysaccharide production protein ExoZ